VQACHARVPAGVSGARVQVMHGCVHECVCTRVPVYMCGYARVFICGCAHVLCTCVYVHVWVRVYMCRYARVSVYM